MVKRAGKQDREAEEAGQWSELKQTFANSRPQPDAAVGLEVS